MDRTFFDVDEDGMTVKLDNGSVWELADASDITKARHWRGTLTITMNQISEDLYEMTNTSNDETITVRRRA